MARPQKPAHEITLTNAGQEVLLQLGAPPSYVARVAGVSPAAVTHWRNGSARPIGDMRRRLVVEFPELEFFLWDLPAGLSQAKIDAARRVFG